MKVNCKRNKTLLETFITLEFRANIWPMIFLLLDISSFSYVSPKSVCPSHCINCKSIFFSLSLSSNGQTEIDRGGNQTNYHTYNFI